ncbi:hypothetical protein BGW80DRAFT_1324815 [Lactifluus volemus]|nr:hypothetical protein BGW80DRAFT_1324815 [Lactifluus volemus]
MVSSLAYELQTFVYTGRRPWRWSCISYIATRILTLISITTTVVGLNLTGKFDCESWFRTVLVTAWLGGCSASFFLCSEGLQYGGGPQGMVITGILWLVDFAAACYVAQGHIQWSPALRSCFATSTNEFKWSLLIRFISNFGLLGTMISGVLWKRDPTRLWNILYFQGLFWISAAILTDVPDVMFQYPNRMVIASSRSYRDLFRNGTDDQRLYPPARAISRNGLGVQVAVDKVVELELGSFELHRDASVPSRVPVGDKESGLYSEPQNKVMKM